MIEKQYIGGGKEEKKQETGNIKPSSGYQKGHSHKIKDLDSFVEFLDENQS